MITQHAVGIVSLLIATGVVTSPSAKANGMLPGMSVQLKIISMPVEFGIARGSQLETDIEAALTDKAITALRKAFPFMGWDHAGKLAPKYRKVAELHFEITGSSAIGGGVVNLKARLRAKDGTFFKIPVATIQVYSKDSPVPTVRNLLSQTTENGEKALRSLITDQKQKWMEHLISKVPLGVEVRDKPDLKAIAVLIPARVLRAVSGQSELKVVYMGKAGNDAPRLIKLHLNPFGPIIDAQDPHAGMQQCSVKMYAYGAGLTKMQYVAHIGKTLAQKKGLKVFVTKHVLESDGIATGLF